MGGGALLDAPAPLRCGLAGAGGEGESPMALGGMGGGGPLWNSCGREPTGTSVMLTRLGSSPVRGGEREGGRGEGGGEGGREGGREGEVYVVLC